MSDLQFGVQFPYDGLVTGETFDRDEAIQELLWALNQRDLAERLGYANSAAMFRNPTLVARDPSDDDPVAWATVDVSEQELDAARELAGEVD